MNQKQRTIRRLKRLVDIQISLFENEYRGDGCHQLRRRRRTAKKPTAAGRHG